MYQPTHLDFVLQVSLEAGKENFALRRLEAVHQSGNGTSHRRLTEQDEFFVEKLGILHEVHIVVDVGFPVDVFDPVFAIVGLVFGECLQSF